MLPHANGHERADGIIQTPNQATGVDFLSLDRKSGLVSLVAQIVDHLNWIEWKVDASVFTPCVFRAIVKCACNRVRWGRGGTLSETDCIGSEPKVSGPRGEIPTYGQIDIGLGASEVFRQQESGCSLLIQGCSVFRQLGKSLPIGCTTIEGLWQCT